MKIHTESLLPGDIIQAVRWGQLKTEIVTAVLPTIYTARDYFKPDGPVSFYHLTGDVTFIKHSPKSLTPHEITLTEDDLRI